MKKIVTLFGILAISLNVLAAEFATGGNGETWTFSKLVEQSAGVVAAGEKPNTYILDGIVTISAGDRFTLDDGIVVMMGQSAEFVIEGYADCSVETGATFTRSGDGFVPRHVFNMSVDGEVKFRNVHFEYVGLKQYGDNPLTVDRCSFKYHQGSYTNGSGALNIGGTGSVTVTNSIFEYNLRCGIAGAANNSCNLTIEGCRFYYNGQSNGNYPQVNVTAAPQVVIRDNTVIGDRSMTRVGGIVVSNLMSATDNGNTLIERNFVKDNRFGIALYSEQRAVVRNNTLIDNDTETNPMQGGSGINVYDPTKTQVTTITGNHIEGHLWGVSLQGGKNVNLGRVDVDFSDEAYNPGMNVFIDNGNSGVHYDLYNNAANVVYAQNNFWQDAVVGDYRMDELIYDKNDDESLGEVKYSPALGLPAEVSFDLNADGTVNVGDVAKLYERILNVNGQATGD